MASYLIDDESNKDVQFGLRTKLLESVKILDMTRNLAGPYGVSVLADAGADVLKVEAPSPDATFEGRSGAGNYSFAGDPASFIVNNRNKRSIAIDVRKPEGKELLTRLIKVHDVVVDNVRAAQRERLGIGWENLQKINPQIISASLTGFGSEGPYKDRAAYDIIVEAMAGVMSVTGPKGGPSVRAGVPIGDMVAGMFMAIGVLEGLEYRRATGKGTHIDIAMLDSQVALLNYLAQYYFSNGFVASHQGRQHESNAMYYAYETADGEVALNAGAQEVFATLCTVLGREDVITDPRFVNQRERLKNRDDLTAIMESEFKKWKTEEIYDALLKVDNIPIGVMNNIEQALHDVQIRHRDMVVKVKHRSGGDFLTLGSPVKSDAVGKEYMSPPGLGQHTIEAMKEVGYSDDEIAKLQEQGIIQG